jgi:hypothetical protein
LLAQLAPDKYRIEIRDFYNMSYLQSNQTYTAKGGQDGAVNRFDFVGLRLMSVE